MQLKLRDETARLFLSYPLDRNEWGEPEAVLDPIAEKYGFAGAGAGTGFGMRDLDYDREKPLTEEEIAAIGAELAALPFPGLHARYAWEVWEDVYMIDDESYCRDLIVPTEIHNG